MAKILNLTQHVATEEQKVAGVAEIPEKMKVELNELITFNVIPSPQEMEDRAHKVAQLYERAHSFLSQDGMIPMGSFAMIGGAPYFQVFLEKELRKIGVEPLHAFSIRKSVDQPQGDGTSRKVAIFSHAGFVTTNPELFGKV